MDEECPVAGISMESRWPVTKKCIFFANIFNLVAEKYLDVTALVKSKLKVI